jgi:DNA mismatch repair protein mutS
MSKLSPMMTHYLETKKQNPDCILFYRLGDFYEMFFDDAKTVAKELELTLTGKDCGLEERAPMCGVPYHAKDVYLNRLVEKGYKVAIAEQVEDPKLAKGLVKREVVKIVTPGTNTGEQAVAEDKNNYLMCIIYIDSKFGISIADIGTGDYFVTEVQNRNEVYDEINRFSPTEILVNASFALSGINLEEIKERQKIVYSSLDNHYFSEISCEKLLKEHFKVGSLEGLGLSDFNNGRLAAGAILQYLYDTQKTSCSQITKIITFHSKEYMFIDSSSRRNLELIETMREKRKIGSLFWVLDNTKTAMGARLLRSYIEQPLIDKQRIIKRQNAIDEFLLRYIDREELREYLSTIYDLERLMGRISQESANPRDLLSFGNSIKIIPHIKSILSSFNSELNTEINSELDELLDVTNLILSSIDEETPITVKEGNIIKTGYNEEVDKFRSAKTEGKNWIASLEESEKEKTGIKGLKIKFNKVFGYYFEVTNSYKNLVPDYFIRKQTLTGSERYTTDELKKIEDVVLGAEDKLNAKEYELFVEIRKEIAKQVVRIQSTAKAVAKLDVMLSLATVAQKQQFVRPDINEEGIIEIKEGRHPVIEKMQSNGMFVSNDTLLDKADNRMNIITGPNMAGKSTYMRQVALIALMAQMGSYVPASSANIGISDRIFTRVGASDDLASGQSTFMVEMTEVANIIRNATKNSLIILDEIGRGTSTFDGLAIAWSVVEYISDKKLIGAKTLFATHYHELTELEGKLEGVNNYCVCVKEQGEDIVFLRKIVKGGADKSYGIQVAKLAGVPSEVLVRARELVEELSGADIAKRAKEIVVAKKGKKVAKNQISLFEPKNENTIEKDILEKLKSIDIDNITPRNAFDILCELQKKVKLS